MAEEVALLSNPEYVYYYNSKYELEYLLPRPRIPLLPIPILAATSSEQ